MTEPTALAEGERAARAALARLLGSQVASRAAVSVLGGGINRRSYLVADGAAQWVLQLPIAGAEGLLDVATEAAVMRAASAAGLAPPVAASDPAHRLLLTHYRAGARAWSPADAREPANIARLAALLRALHRVEAPAPDYVAARFAREYRAGLEDAARARGAALDARSIRWADELADLARDYDARHPPSALCHNDLVAANVLDDGNLVLVDFEYAVRGSPVLDLAGLAGLNDFGERERRVLLDAYHVEGGAPISLDDLASTARMVLLVAYLWARSSELRVQDTAPYHALANAIEAKLA